MQYIENIAPQGKNGKLASHYKIAGKQDRPKEHSSVGPTDGTGQAPRPSDQLWCTVFSNLLTTHICVIKRGEIQMPKHITHFCMMTSFSESLNVHCCL